MKHTSDRIKEILSLKHLLIIQLFKSKQVSDSITYTDNVSNADPDEEQEIRPKE